MAIILNAQREMNRKSARRAAYHLKASDLKPLGHLEEAAIAHSSYNYGPVEAPREVTKTEKRVAASGAKARRKGKKKSTRGPAKKTTKKSLRPMVRRKPAKAAKHVAPKTTPKAAEEEEEEGEE